MKFVMETFDEAVLPRLSGQNKCWSDFLLCQPVLHGFSGKFAAVVGAQKNGGDALLHNPIQKRDDVFGKERGGNQDSLTLTGELIQNAQGLVGTSIC